MRHNENYDLLVPHARKQPNGESEKAEALFKKFINEGFAYDDISNHPDWPNYASAEFLFVLLPQMIDEMLGRVDTINYLIYPMISAIDPLDHVGFPSYEERTLRLIELADKKFAQKACQFLEAMKKNPPNGPEQVDRLLSFWQEKLKELS